MMHERDEKMISVKSSELKLIATTSIDLEHEACEDIENVLVFIVSSVRCIPLERGGVVLVYTDDGYDPLKLIKTLVQSDVRCFWIYPVYKACRASYEDVLKCSLELLLQSSVSKPIRLLGKCRKRGVYIDSCSNLLKYVMPFLESLNIVSVDFKRPEYILRIEVVGSIAALSLYPASIENTFRVKRAPTT
jgi:tRNA(Ser,Leu) C12 N-acetylase TAN1